MNRVQGVTLSLLRIFAAMVYLFPGGMKLLGWFGGLPPGVHLTPRLVAAGWIEMICGSLILLGLLTRPAAFIASGEMAFAYFIGHFPRGFWPIQNHGEPAVLLCFIFLYLSAAGPGTISLDALIRRPRAARVVAAGP